jgi:hypothetical protein
MEYCFSYLFSTRTDDELKTLLFTSNIEELAQSGVRTDFFSFGWKKRPSRQFQYFIPQSLRWIGDTILSLIFDQHSLIRLDTEHLKEVVIDNVGTWTFQEAFDRTGRIINITGSR